MNPDLSRSDVALVASTAALCDTAQRWIDWYDDELAVLIREVGNGARLALGATEIRSLSDFLNTRGAQIATLERRLAACLLARARLSGLEAASVAEAVEALGWATVDMRLLAGACRGGIDVEEPHTTQPRSGRAAALDDEADVMRRLSSQIHEPRRVRYDR